MDQYFRSTPKAVRNDPLEEVYLLIIPVESQFNNDAILEFRCIHIGGYIHSGLHIPNLTGYLQQFWFNGNAYIEMARNFGTREHTHRGITPIIRVTGQFEKRIHRVHKPVAFRSKHTFIGLPILKAYFETNIYFQVRLFTYFCIFVK